MTDQLRKTHRVSVKVPWADSITKYKVSIENFFCFLFQNKSSLRISNNRICCINYSLQRSIRVIYNWYVDTKEGIQVIQVACFCFIADRSTRCVMLNSQSFRALAAGDKTSGALQARRGCAQSGGPAGQTEHRAPSTQARATEEHRRPPPRTAFSRSGPVELREIKPKEHLSSAFCFQAASLQSIAVT